MSFWYNPILRGPNKTHQCRSAIAGALHQTLSLLLHPGFTLKLSTFLTPTAHFTAPPLSLRHRECLTQPLIGITSLTPTFKLPTPSPTPFSNTQYRQRALPTEHAHPAPPHLGIFAPFPSPHPMPPEERHNFLNFSLH